MTTIRLYCVCGAKVEAQSDPPAAAEFIAAWFRERHGMDGHGLTDAATARRARAAKEGAS